jgi:phosphatidylinositol 3-kinase
VSSTLKKGRQKCKVWMGVEADGLVDTTTPSPVETGDEMDRLEKVRKTSSRAWRCCG